MKERKEEKVEEEEVVVVEVERSRSPALLITFSALSKRPSSNCSFPTFAFCSFDRNRLLVFANICFVI